MKSIDWMPFFGDDFWTSERVAQMDDSAAMLYQWLLWRQFQHGSLPGPQILRRLPHRWQGEVFDKLWPQVAACFDVLEDGRLSNPRCRAERDGALANHEKARARAEAANAARWGSKRDPKASSNGTPVGMRGGVLKDNATCRSDRTGPDQTRPDQTVPEPPTPKAAPAKRAARAVSKDPDLDGMLLGTCLDTRACKAAITEWLAYKRERRQGYTELGLRALLSQLAGWGAEQAEDAIRQSMASNWAGLFEPKPDLNGRGGGAEPKGLQGLRNILARKEPAHEQTA